MYSYAATHHQQPHAHSNPQQSAQRATTNRSSSNSHMHSSQQQSAHQPQFPLNTTADQRITSAFPPLPTAAAAAAAAAVAVPPSTPSHHFHHQSSPSNLYVQQQQQHEIAPQSSTTTAPPNTMNTTVSESTTTTTRPPLVSLSLPTQLTATREFHDADVPAAVAAAASTTTTKTAVVFQQQSVHASASSHQPTHPLPTPPRTTNASNYAAPSSLLRPQHAAATHKTNTTLNSGAGAHAARTGNASVDATTHAPAVLTARALQPKRSDASAATEFPTSIGDGRPHLSDEATTHNGKTGGCESTPLETTTAAVPIMADVVACARYHTEGDDDGGSNANANAVAVAVAVDAATAAAKHGSIKAGEPPPSAVEVGSAASEMTASSYPTPPPSTVPSSAFHHQYATGERTIRESRQRVSRV